jgi:hypothetical protein
MYIRSKVVKGATYYQVVDGYRDAEGRVRHRTVASLGRCPTIEEAILQIGATEARIRRRLAKLPEAGLSRTLRTKRDRLAARLTQQGARRTVLQEVAKAGSVDTTAHAP